jgi:hypothetical protein
VPNRNFQNGFVLSLYVHDVPIFDVQQGYTSIPKELPQLDLTQLNHTLRFAWLSVQDSV